MAVIYLRDSSIYLQPTYAEAVTNFLKFAREKKFAENLLITDAGYLPLLPRLITLFIVKVLRVPSAYALYLMQFTACLLCSMIWSFFVLYPFHRLMKLPGRILWCILVMLTCFYEETLFFTNHAYWGIYFLLLMMIADLNAFPRWLYAVLTAFGAGLCLSKGTYAVVLPLAVLALIFFYRGMDRREKVFLCTVGVLLPFLRRETVDGVRRRFWLVVMYQLMVTAFFLMTVKPVPVSWKNMGNIAFGQMGHKYEIFSDIGFYLLVLTGSGLLRQAAESGAGRGILHGICEIGGRYGKCYFAFDDPVSGVRKIEFADAGGKPVWYKDYIAWITAW